ncbi:hypothetical protein LL946_12835 [Knoellia locipacati]|uniref:hypothetical protein n=1 Tax=Knoellia locipacati TaxID=882824 RepID=UPI003850CC75
MDVLSSVSRVRLSSGLRTQPGAHPRVTVRGVSSVTIPVAIAQVLQRCGLVAALVPLDAALRRKRCTLEQVGSALRDIVGENSSSAKRLARARGPEVRLRG